MIIGLTGGIGSGKSTVAKIFAERGFPIVDADKVAREVVETPQLLEQLQKAFGSTILDGTGKLRRSRLAELAFATQEKTELLNSIVQKPIADELRARLHAAENDPANTSHAVIYDAPLIVESGSAGDFDYLIVVEAEKAVRIQRLVTQRHMDEADVANRMAQQATDEQRRGVANWVITNNRTELQLSVQVDKVLADLIDNHGLQLPHPGEGH